MYCLTKLKFDNKNFGVIAVNSYKGGNKMQSKVYNSVIVDLSLNEEEARWLKRLVQNPTGTESKEDRDMRQKFWEALEEIEA